MPDGLSKVTELTFLQPAEMRFLSQIQGRTYANMFALVERYIGAKTLEISKDHWFGDQVALEALVRLTDEELKHQELFRRLEQMAADGNAGRLQLQAAAERSRQRGAQQVDLGRARPDARHRAVLASALSIEHRARREPVGAVEGRVPVPLEGRVAARDHRRARMAARARAADATRSATRASPI